MVNELPSAVRQSDQAIEQFEADRGHGKRRSAMALSSSWLRGEGPPTLGRSSGTFDHVLGDGRLGDLDAKLGKLALDARRTP